MIKDLGKAKFIMDTAIMVSSPGQRGSEAG